MKCSICEKPIIKDRYNFALEIERQDFPPSGNWSKSYSVPTEDSCSKCFNLIQSYLQHIRDNIRKNKGEYKSVGKQ